MNPDGTCPSCRRLLTEDRVTPKSLDLKKLAGEEDSKVPWHFKLLLVALAIYLGWRFVQLIGWLF